jgi:hypothetical protein
MSPMEKISNLLWPLIVFGVLGGLIDFLIGRTGRDRVKKFVEKWWVRFNDIHWKNFGREEGLFAGELIERWFGRKIWSLRRIVTAILVLCVFSLVDLGRFAIHPNQDTLLCFECMFFEDPDVMAIHIFLSLIGFIIGFSLSVSFTKMIAIGMAKLCGNSTQRNIVIFTVSLVFNYIVLVVWVPIMLNVKLYGTFYLTLLATDADTLEAARIFTVGFLQFALRDINISWYPELIDMFRQPVVFVDMFAFLCGIIHS